MKPEIRNHQYRTTTIGRSAYLRGRIGWQGLKAAEFLQEGPYLVTGTDFARGRIMWDRCYRVSEKRYAEADYIHVKNHDVLITKDGTIGKVVFVESCPDKAVLNSGIFLLRCTDGSFDHRYIYYLLQSHVFRKFLDDNLAGSTIQHLYQHVFKTFAFTVPHLAEQTKIAELLHVVDRAIEQTEALLSKQQSIKIGLMKDLLAFGLDERGNLRSESTHEFKNSPLGRIPEEWAVHSIAPFGSRNRPWLRTGPFGSDLNTKHWVIHGCPVLTIGSLGVGQVIESELLFVSVSASELLKSFRLMPGDIVFSRVADIGRSLVVRPAYSGAIISSNLMRISLDVNRAEPAYLYTNIAFNPAIRSQLRASANSGGRELVNGAILSGLIFPWPTLEEQRRIVDALRNSDDQIASQIRERDKLTRLKAGLMKDLFTGQSHHENAESARIN